jgi:hypothetical protein
MYSMTPSYQGDNLKFMVFILASEHLDKHLLVWQDITASDLDESSKPLSTVSRRKEHRYARLFPRLLATTMNSPKSSTRTMGLRFKLPMTNSRSNDVLSTETPLRGRAPFHG